MSFVEELFTDRMVSCGFGMRSFFRTFKHNYLLFWDYQFVDVSSQQLNVFSLLHFDNFFKVLGIKVFGLDH